MNAAITNEATYRAKKYLRGGDDAVEVRFHEVGDDIHVFEVDGIGGIGDEVLDRDHVLVLLEVPQQLDLAQDSLCVDEVVEHVCHLLDGHLVRSQPQLPKRVAKRVREISRACPVVGKARQPRSTRQPRSSSLLTALQTGAKPRR